MKSIFDLNTKTTDLSSANQGLIQYHYEKLPAIKPITADTGLANGDLTFRWSYGDNVYWIPNKSFFNIGYTINNPDGGQSLLGYEQVALNMNSAACLFKSAQYRVADQSVSQITQNLAQVDALKSRMTKSGDWLNSMGSTMNNTAATYADREQRLFSLGNRGTQVPYLTIEHILGADAANNNGNDYFSETLQGDSQFTIILNKSSGLCELTATNNVGLFDWRDQVVVGDIIEFHVSYANGAILAVETTGWTLRGTISSVQSLTLNFIADMNTMQLAQLRNAVGNLVTIGPIDVASVAKNNFDPKFYRGSVQGTPLSGRDQGSNLYWIPPLSIFDVQHAMPCAGTKQEIILSPFENLVYQRNIIESRGRNKTVEDDFEFQIISCEFNLLVCQSNQLPKQLEFMLDFDEIQCQSQKITSRSTDLTFDVVGSCNGITIAFQDGFAGVDSRYPLTKFKIRNNLEMTLTRYYIRYEDQVPKPDFSSNNDYFLALDGFKTLYLKSKMYDGSFFSSSPETYQEYMDRGLYIYHPFPKTASSRNTSVYTSTSFDVTRADNAIATIETDQLNPNLLLFQHYKKVVLCKVVNGKIVNCIPIDS